MGIGEHSTHPVPKTAFFRLPIEMWEEMRIDVGIDPMKLCVLTQFDNERAWTAS